MIEAKILLLIVYFCARVNGLGILGQYAMNLENVIFHEKKTKNAAFNDFHCYGKIPTSGKNVSKNA